MPFFISPLSADTCDNETVEFSHVTAGWQHTCAIIQGGTVQCWGWNNHGQLGRGDTSGRYGNPQNVTGLNGTVISLSAGAYHTCAIIQNGTVQCWGDNNRGQLGRGDTSGEYGTPQTVTGLSGTVTSLEAGWQHTCAIIQNGTVQCWGDNEHGQLGRGHVSGVWHGGYGSPQNVTGLSGTVTSLSAGSSHTCAIIQNGTVQCWGRNHYGELGRGDTSGEYGSPQNVTGLSGTVTSLSAGDYHTCAIIQGGNVQCWGRNQYGQLGRGDVSGNSHAGYGSPQNVTGLSGTVTSLSAGDYHTCAIIQGGNVQCWGSNNNGKLGRGNVGGKYGSPQNVTGLSGTVTSLSAGTHHTCAIIQGGTVQCWGSNKYGQLGRGDVSGHLSCGWLWEPSSCRHRLKEMVMTSLSAGGSHTCVIIQGGTVQCWGSNYDGKLGRGNVGGEYGSPQTVTGLSGTVTSLSAGTHHTCAIIQGGTVQCWGSNAQGQLGKGTQGGKYGTLKLSQA